MNMNGHQHKTSFAQRIDLLIDEVGSMAALARIAGVSETTIRNWKNGKSDAMRENLIALMKGARVELSWLVLGEGPMRHDIISDHAGPEPESFSICFGSPQSEVEQKDGLARINMIFNVRCHSAFFGKASSSDAIHSVCISGDCMSPALLDGDFVLFDRGDDRVQREGPYVLDVDGSIQVRRLQRFPGNRVRASCDHPAYTYFEFDLDETREGPRILGRVIGVIRKL